MKIIASSDWHFPHRIQKIEQIEQLVKMIADEKPDGVLLAGDFQSWYDKTYLEKIFSLLSRLPCPVGIVTGNHDTWTVMTLSSSWRILSQFCHLAKSYGLVPLDKTSYLQIGDLYIVGNCGWYDYSLGDEYWTTEQYDKQEYRGSVWQDVQYSKWKKSNPETCKVFLRDLKRKLKSIPEHAEVIAMTHMAALSESVLWTGASGWDFCNAFLGSKTLGDLLNKYGVKLHLYGHLHDDYNSIPERAIDTKTGLESYNVCYYPKRPFVVLEKNEDKWEVYPRTL